MFEEIEEVKRQKEENERNKTFNGLTAHEWALYTQSVFALQGVSARNELRLKHGSTYPKELTDRLIKMYSREGDLVFDPFVGIGTTLKSAFSLNRKGVGIELNKEFYNYAIEYLGLNNESFLDKQISLYNDDCRNLEKYLIDNTVQLTITSPPYADYIKHTLKKRQNYAVDEFHIRHSRLRQYSDDPNDFNNLSYDEFLNEIEKLFRLIYNKTRQKGYLLLVVRNYRKEGSYVNFHSDIAEAGKRAGFKWIDVLVWDQSIGARISVTGYPHVFYTNMRLSYIVVLRKE